MSLTKVPSIPVPTPSNQLDVTRAIKGILDVREGYIGDPLDQNVTFRDLVDAGAVVERPAWVKTSGLSPVLPPWSESDGYDPQQDYTPPSAPANVTATSLFNSVQLQWDLPPERNFAYAEIWRSSTNAIGAAVMIGTSDGRFYVDSIGTASTRYYWVRFVTQADVKGPYNATNGLAGNASDDPTYVIGVLSDAYGSTSLAPFFQLDAPQTINGVSIPAGTYIKSAFIADATITNAKIKDAAIDNAKIANLDAAKITTGYISADRLDASVISAKVANLDAAVITTGQITNARIGNLDASKITTGRLTAARIDGSGLTVTAGAFTAWAWPAAGSSGFYLGSEGLLMGNANNGKYFQVTSGGDIYSPQFSIVNGNATFSGNLNAAGGTFSGTLNAVNGTFSGILSANVTTYAPGNFWELGFNGTNTYVVAGGMVASSSFTIPVTQGNRYVITAMNPKWYYQLNWGIMSTTTGAVLGTWTLTTVVSGFTDGSKVLSHSYIRASEIADIYLYGSGAYYDQYTNADLYGGSRGFNLPDSYLTTRLCQGYAAGSTLTVNWYLAFNSDSKADQLFAQWRGAKIDQINTNDVATWKVGAGRGNDPYNRYDYAGLSVDVFSTQYA